MATLHHHSSRVHSWWQVINVRLCLLCLVLIVRCRIDISSSSNIVFTNNDHFSTSAKSNGASWRLPASDVFCCCPSSLCGILCSWLGVKRNFSGNTCISPVIELGVDCDTASHPPLSA